MSNVILLAKCFLLFNFQIFMGLFAPSIEPMNEVTGLLVTDELIEFEN